MLSSLAAVSILLIVLLPLRRCSAFFPVCPLHTTTRHRYYNLGIHPLPLLASSTAGSSGSSSQEPADATTTTTTTKDDDNNLDDWEEILDVTQVLEVAERAVRAAGGVIISHTGCCSETDDACEIKYSIKDVVTEYDKEAQDAVLSIISEHYPQHRFLGEEDVDAGGAASEAALLEQLLSSTSQQEQDDTTSSYMWICDPIDGTANFASGLELSAVTLALVRDGQVLLGVIYDPYRDELFYAIRSEGAFLTTTNQEGSPQTQRLQAAGAISTAKDAIINAGCPADPNAFAASLRGIAALNSQSRGIRMVACSALTLSWIASGRLAAHFGYDLSSWDLAAGALLIQEAGGTVTDLDGTPYKLETRNMLCSNGLIHDEVLQVLQKADATSFTRA